MTRNKTAPTTPAATGQGSDRPASKVADVRVFLARFVFPQWVRTALVALIWLGLVPLYVRLIATFAVYGQARVMAVGVIMGSAIAVHLWPTRTPGWRTLVWAALLSTFTGAFLLVAGAGDLALTGATAVVFVVVGLRVNSNARRILDRVRLWRATR